VKDALNAHLQFIYDAATAEALLPKVMLELEQFRTAHPVKALAPAARLGENDVVLITYGDQITTSGEAPLVTLRRFMADYLQAAVSAVHLLPFYPYTSDDGFSVVDYLTVDPQLGDWDDVRAFRPQFRLMFDAVINHVSASHAWVKGFIAGDARYQGYVMVTDPTLDLSGVTRPRTTPLLTPFETTAGTKHLWTTFSADQVDLNYANPEVLLEVLRTLLRYVAEGAEIIRLDAVTYLWKEVGTPCVHHPKTHRVLQFLRSALELAAPYVVLLTETNVPHQENISYFGDGTNEAQMVYNFALPPLVLYSFMTEDAALLSSWAASLRAPSDETTFFNFLASHDGIGVRPVETILGTDGIAALAERALAHGGLVSYKRNSDGSDSPYELNISYFDALSDPKGTEPLERQIARFVTAHSIMMSLPGVPGIYVHSLLGSRSDHAGVARTGRNRSINRQKFTLEALTAELIASGSLRRQVLENLSALLRVRRRHPAFHPQSPTQILDVGSGMFAVARGTDDARVICLHNVTSQTQVVPSSRLAGAARDLLTGEALIGDVTLAPLSARWLTTAS
jgi:sucrose phosphorylase